MWLHLKRENQLERKSINMDHVSNVIFMKKEHCTLLFQFQNISQISIKSDNYLNDYRIERWFKLFQTGNISQHDSILELTNDKNNTNDRYFVIDYIGSVKSSSESLDSELSVAESLAKDDEEFYYDHETSAYWVYDEKTNKRYSHFVLDKITGEKHFPDF